MTLNNIHKIFEYLEKDNQLFGPKQGKELRFSKLRSPKELDLSGKIPINSLKEVLFPASHELYLFDDKNVFEIKYDSPKIVFFGLTIFDLKALDFLNQVFEKDLYYQARRREIIVIGLSYTPTKEDAADELLKNYEEDILEHLQFDLFIDRISKNNFKLFTGTRRGQEILEKLKIKDYEHIQFAGLIREQGIDPVAKKNRGLVSKSTGGEVWQKWGKLCLNCGKCTIACPTCYCFEGERKLKNKTKGWVNRIWSSCFYTEFGEIAGKIKFLKTSADRIWNWYNHKHVRNFDEFSISGCVGCGRCDRVCPANIKRLEVLKSLEK